MNCYFVLCVWALYSEVVSYAYCVVPRLAISTELLVKYMVHKLNDIGLYIYLVKFLVPDKKGGFVVCIFHRFS